MKIARAMTFGIFLVLIISDATCTVQAEVKPFLWQGEKIYSHYCTPCHGSDGRGKGFNAKYLDPRPANHTDDGLMKKRTDKELYDAVTGGGRAAGKSTLMPPWGNTFSETQIKSLVLYLRKLCGCEGG